MQIYKDLNIGTAKVNKDEQSLVPHHLIDIITPDKEFSVQEYVSCAKNKIDELFIKNKLPIIVGGTGFFIKSLIYPYSFCGAPKDDEIRKKYNKILQEQGIDYLYNLLQQKDYEASLKIHKNDTKRVIRALEIFDITGKQKTELNIEENNEEYNTIFIVLNCDRQKLYERINLRVDKMFDCGLFDEFEKVLKLYNLNQNHQSMQAIGYKELFDLKNKVCTLEEAKEKIKKNTRNYAKRQITFFKRIIERKDICLNSTSEAVSEIINRSEIIKSYV
jgi:tRNA dimethylallyltransferase